MPTPDSVMNGATINRFRSAEPTSSWRRSLQPLRSNASVGMDLPLRTRTRSGSHPALRLADQLTRSIRPGRGRFGWLKLLARREDLAQGAAEAGDHVLAGEFVILEQEADRAIDLVNGHSARLGVDHPDEGHAHLPIVGQLLIQLVDSILGR